MSILRERDQVERLGSTEGLTGVSWLCWCWAAIYSFHRWVIFAVKTKMKATGNKTRIGTTGSLNIFSAPHRPLYRAAVGVCVSGADQHRAEGAHPETGAWPEHHPGHVLPPTPQCRRVGGQRHGEYPGADQRGHCDVLRYVWISTETIEHLSFVFKNKQSLFIGQKCSHLFTTSQSDGAEMCAQFAVLLTLIRKVSWNV